MKELHDILTECAAEAVRIARGVHAEQLTEPSSCGEWDVRTLVNHWVLYTSHGLEHRALRTTLPEEMTERDFTVEPDWAQHYAEQLDRALAAWSTPAAWEGDVDTGYAVLPATDIVAAMIEELAVHGWDVARATGQRPPQLSAAAVELLLQTVTSHAELYRQYDGYADPVPVASDADAYSRALAASGRDPQLSAV